MEGAAIHSNILANMADGVLTLDLSGRIIMFNAAAGRILDLEPAAVIGRRYAETFFDDPNRDDFNEVVLKAIYDAEVTHSAEIDLRVGDELRALSLSTTFLSDGADGQAKKLGVIVVFSDVTERRNRRRITRLFGEYVDPRIVDRILQRGDALATSRREVMTISFCDLENFTRLGELLEPDALISFINSYLSCMSMPIGDHGGITDKFIGDAIMAFWGPPFTEGTDHAALACTVALEQRARLDAFRAEVVERFHLPLAPTAINIRAGIATGEVVAGTVGRDNAKNYTVIGDPVNVAARLEAINKSFGSRILVAEATWRQVANDFELRELDTVLLRGRARTERVFELMAAQGELDDDRQRLRDHFAVGLAAYRTHDWRAAGAAFTRCLEIDAGDTATQVFLGRLARLSEAPPGDDWDGVWRVGDVTMAPRAAIE